MKRARYAFSVGPFGPVRLIALISLVVWVLVLSLASDLRASSIYLNAHGVMLMDMTTGKVLYEQDADYRIPPASVTKILTMYMVLEAIKDGRVHPWDEVAISRKANATGGSKMFVKAGERVQLRDLFKGMAISSGNDACVAVSEYMAGSTPEFVRRMNIKAQALGMTNTVFKTPNGLPAPGQMTTARDMMKLSISYLRRFPEALSIHSMKNFTHNQVTTYNRNRLLGSCEGVDGLKTGFVCAAGYNIVATAKRGKTRLVAVVLGAPSASIRVAETRKLIEAGFAMVRGENPVVTAEQTDPPKTVKVSKKAHRGKAKVVTAKAVHKGKVPAAQIAKASTKSKIAKAKSVAVVKAKKPAKQTAAEAKKAKSARAAL